MGVTVRIPTDKPHLGYFVFVNHRGVRKSFRVGEKKAADQMARQIRRDLAQGKLTLTRKSPSPTLDTVFEDWLETHAKVHCKPTICSPRSITGSPKALTRKICKRPRHCWLTFPD